MRCYGTRHVSYIQHQRNKMRRSTRKKSYRDSPQVTFVLSSLTKSLQRLKSCCKAFLLQSARAEQAASKQEVAKDENFLYELQFWPVSALWAPEVPQVCVCVSVRARCQHSIRSASFPAWPAAAGAPHRGKGSLTFVKHTRRPDPHIKQQRQRQIYWLLGTRCVAAWTSGENVVIINNELLCNKY